MTVLITITQYLSIHKSLPYQSGALIIRPLITSIIFLSDFLKLHNYICTLHNVCTQR